MSYPPPYQPYQPSPPPRRKRKGLRVFLGVSGALLTLLVVAGVLGALVKTPPPAAPPASAPPAATAVVSSPSPKPAAARTVTYVVTGSPADVTYGPAGSSLTATVPLDKTVPLGTPAYYSVSAQLQGGGAVACKILVDGKAVSSAQATGSYNIASCEISPNPLTGSWEDTNSGG